MAQHTAGPWKKKGSYILTDQGKDSICIAQIHDEAERFDDNQEEVTANSNLIVSGPDLLAACELAIIYLEDGARNTALDILRKAHAKAKGEA